MSASKQENALGIAASRLDPASTTPLHRQIYEALREDILRGHLAPGQKLLPTRQLARELEVSRNTVVEAFEQLLAEGYLRGRQGAGTFVTDELPDDLLQRPGAPSELVAVEEVATEPEVSQMALALSALSMRPGSREVRPFQGGLPALEELPTREWARLAARVRKELPASALGYGDVAGYEPLREALATYLRTSRGLECNAEQILVVAGSQQGLDLTIRTLLNPGDRACIEDPGYPGTRAALLAAGVEAVPIPVDDGGMLVDQVADRKDPVRMVCVTPSHHYPLGATLSLRRRLRLLEWAHQVGGWIVEDDYDSEYRYSGRPLTAMKALDRGGRVIYVGTFSKVLAPGLRLGYLVVPLALVEAFTAVRAAMDRQSPLLEQATMAAFLNEGHFMRHIRRMRTLYASRQEALLAAAHDHLTGRLDVRPSPSGMHLVGWLPAETNDRAVSQAAGRAGVTAAALSGYSVVHQQPPGLILGYAAFDAKKLREGVRQLAGVVL